MTCRRGSSRSSAILELANGETWHFTLQGAQLSIEESTYFVDSAGPRRSLGIVARGATFGETDVAWTLTRA